ncbi:MAG: hypothetical protein HOP95_10650 [Sphingomonas sp.]|nr:hypothetical protein [Sphingomonas sp.]
MSEIVAKRIASPWRIIGWGAAVALLAAPFVAMQLHAKGVDWSAGDFIFAGAIFALIGGLLEFAVWKIKSGWYRAGVAVALLGYLLVIWTNLAVGIVGSEDNPANQLFFLALLIGIAGACIGRFRAKGMAWSMLATGVSLLVVFAIAVLPPTDDPFVHHGVEFAGTSIFAALLLGSAWLFRRAAAAQSSSSS